MGEAKAVHFRFDPPQGRKKARTIGFIAQVGVGVVVLPAIIQSRRYKSYQAELTKAHPIGTVIEQFDTTFTGLVADRENGQRNVKDGRLVGTLEIDESGSQKFDGTLKGTDESGKTFELKIFGSRSLSSHLTDLHGELTWEQKPGRSENFQIGSKICAFDEITPINMAGHHGERVEPEFSAEKRLFISAIAGDAIADDAIADDAMASDAMASDVGRIIGTIPRSIVDHYQVPIEDRAVQHLIRKNGKLFELALVYTWIAGLLNVLAVWDAVSGPAYGYGDEPVPEKKKKGAKPGDSNAKQDSNAKPKASEAPAVKELATTATTTSAESSAPSASESNSADAASDDVASNDAASKDVESPAEPKES
jgi:hypothetical protein